VVRAKNNTTPTRSAGALLLVCGNFIVRGLRAGGMRNAPCGVGASMGRHTKKREILGERRPIRKESVAASRTKRERPTPRNHWENQPGAAVTKLVGCAGRDRTHGRLPREPTRRWKAR